MPRIRRLLSLRRWKQTLVRVYRIIRSPRVPLADKLLFLVPVALYWVLPDVFPVPFLPIDDAAVTMIAAEVFLRYIERKHPHA